MQLPGDWPAMNSMRGDSMPLREFHSIRMEFVCFDHQSRSTFSCVENSWNSLERISRRNALTVWGWPNFLTGVIRRLFPQQTSLPHL
jgi:hypothetical protein